MSFMMAFTCCCIFSFNALSSPCFDTVSKGIMLMLVNAYCDTFVACATTAIVPYPKLLGADLYRTFDELAWGIPTRAVGRERVDWTLAGKVTLHIVFV
jgi:hypothetical protein